MTTRVKTDEAVIARADFWIGLRFIKKGTAFRGDDALVRGKPHLFKPLEAADRDDPGDGERR